jgi:CRP/FNR family transcriptional regulator, cyclic AMP receptor protein
MHIHKHSEEDELSRVPIFAGLGPKERSEIRSMMSGANIEAGQVLVQQGTYGHEFFVIQSGTAKVERDGELVAEIGPGDFQGEISLLDGGLRTATVTATSPMALLVASHQEFTSLLDKAPIIARQMLPGLVARLRSLADHPHTD